MENNQTNPSRLTHTLESLSGRIQKDLLSGIKITPLYAFSRYGTCDMRKRLSELRNEGMNISWYMEENLHHGGNHRVHYMRQEDIDNWNNQ